MPLPPQLVFLQCTSPFTSGEQIDQVLAALDAPAVNSSFAVAAWHGFLWRSDGRGINHDPQQPRQRRQDLEPAYLETGAIYAMDMAAFRKSGSRFCPPGSRLSSSIPARRSTHPPIWLSAERWLRQHHGNFAGSRARPMAAAADKRLAGRTVAAVACFDSFGKMAMTLLAACRHRGADTTLHLLEINNRALSRRQRLEIRRTDPRTRIEKHRWNEFRQLTRAMADNVDVLVLGLDGRRSRGRTADAR